MCPQIRLLELLDPAYDGRKMNLYRALLLHSKRSGSGEILAKEIEHLLLEVISLRQRDYAHCKIKLTANETHAHVIRSLMQLCNMYHPGKYTVEVFSEYLRDDTPLQARNYIFVSDEQWKQEEQQRPRNMGTSWRRGSDSSVSSASSSIYSMSSAASSTSSITSSTRSFAFDKFMPMQRPSTAAPRLEGNGAYVPPAPRGSREDILQKASWR